MKQYSIYILLILCINSITIFAQQLPPDPLAYNPQPFDVLHYDVKMDLTQALPSRNTHGRCDIHIRWIENPKDKAFIFHLQGLKVDSIIMDSKKVIANEQGKQEESTFHYSIPAPIEKLQGDTSVVIIFYGGTMTDELGIGTWGGVSYGDSTVYALGVGFQANYVSTTRHWMPCFDHPSDKATFKGTFIARKGMTVASVGTLSTNQTDDFTFFEWTHNYPCATYLLTFSLAPYKTLRFTENNLPPMVVYARARDTAATRISFKLLPRMVRSFTQLFGTYPFDKVGYCLTQKGAMEHQTMVSYNTNLAQSKDTVNSVAAHELAHQWFGDCVSPLDFRHAWLNESFATFCESAWSEELFGFEKGFLTSQSTKINRYINTIIKNEKALPLYDFSRTAPSSNYPETIYQKGAVVLGMLRHKVGADNYYKAIRAYLQRYAYKNATTDSLKNVFEKETNIELDSFFKEWVIQAGIPELRFTVLQRENNSVQLRVEQVQAETYGTYTEIPVELGFVRPDNQTTVYSKIMVKAKDETFTINNVPSDYTSILPNQGPTTRSLFRTQSITDITSVSDLNITQDNVSISPIPASGYISVITQLPYKGISIIDNNGNTIAFSQERINDTTIRIDTNTWISGIYFVRVEFERNFVTYPVIVVKE